MGIRLLAIAVIVAIIAAWVYSSRAVAPMITSGPENWPVPEGGPDPVPTIIGPPVTAWRQNVIDAANALSDATDNIRALSPSHQSSARLLSVARIVEAAPDATRATLKVLLWGVPALGPGRVGISREMRTALLAANEARTRLILALDAPDIAVYRVNETAVFHA